MTERGAGLPRAPRVYSLSEQAQLRRRLRYALQEQPELSDATRASLALWAPPGGDDPQYVQHWFRVLAQALSAAGVPEHLPTNAAAPPPRRKP